jgi:hypothetical protein
MTLGFRLLNILESYSKGHLEIEVHTAGNGKKVMERISCVKREAGG